jgi:hypothetical protein
MKIAGMTRRRRREDPRRRGEQQQEGNNDCEIMRLPPTSWIPFLVFVHDFFFFTEEQTEKSVCFIAFQ